MLSYPDALAYQVVAAQKKTTAATRIGSYTIASMLGGAYIGVAVVLMLTAAGPFFDNNSPATKLVSGLVFGVALSLVTVAGGELVTSNMMTLTQGLSQKAITINVWGRTLTVNFLGNLLGGIVFGTLVWLSGVTHKGTPAYAYMESILTAKASESITELFFRAVLCNILVCLAIWSGIRLKSEVARLVMIFWCLLAFITSGFEHVVANMTTFTVGLLSGVTSVTIADFATNMVVVGAGNLVGGGAILGMAYVVLARAEARAANEGTHTSHPSVLSPDEAATHSLAAAKQN
jgi:nitrite transporter NirC